jgi:predicted ferric reductase
MKEKLKNNSGVIIILVLCLIPIIFWVFLLPLNLRFNDFSSSFTSIGQLTGLLGTVLFAINLIIATRLKLLENYFNGLNRVYINHHLIGGLALILLLIHPLVLAIKFIPFSLHYAALFLLPTVDNPAKFYGIIALLIMIILLVLTFHFRPRYHIWKFTHKFLGLAFFIASLHIYLIPSDISRSYSLRAYMLFIVGLGLISAIYRILIAGSLPKVTGIVRQVNQLNDKVIEIVIEMKERAIKYTSGQFIFVSFIDKNIGKESHPFSITSETNGNIVKLVIKDSGDYTAKLKNLAAGTLAKIEGPFGKFNFRNFNSKNQIWLAGGIGVTPFLSMIRSLKSDDNYQIDFYYLTKNQEEAVFLDEILAIAKTNNRIKVFPFFSEVKGRINATLINEMSGGLDNKEILLCGPVLMMRNLKDQLIVLGVNKEFIHSEEFELS